MKIIAIVAAAENNVIGINNDMPWRLPDDFKFFKQNTMGHFMLMGRNTWESIGSKPLPGRIHLVISTTLDIQLDNVFTFDTIEQALDYAKRQNAEKLFIIGGGKIYAQTLNICDEVLLTRIHIRPESGEVFFPNLQQEEWQRIWSEHHPADERHPHAFTFERWVRK